MAEGIVCEKCGFVNTKYHEKCLKCGQAFPHKKETSAWIWWLVGAIAVIVLWLLFR
jgi:DNA-directed RNA polymerase subunit RPC12/RpoP